MKTNTLKNLKQSKILEPMTDNITNLKPAVTDSVIENITDQRPPEIDDIPIGHPLRRLEMLKFRHFLQATGYLPESMHVDLSELNDRQLIQFAQIAARQSVQSVASVASD